VVSEEWRKLHQQKLQNSLRSPRIIKFIKLRSTRWDSTPGGEILRILWNHRVQYRVHNKLTLVHILSQMSLVPTHFLGSTFNVIFPSSPKSSKRFPSLRFTHQNLLCISLPSIRATCHRHFTLVNLTTPTTYEPLHSAVSSSLLLLLSYAKNAFLSTLLLYSLGLRP